MARRLSQGRILEQLRLAAKKGDRTALQLALDEMKTLAFSPRYWDRYVVLLSNPLARIVDLLVLKQGERIARQRGVTIGRRKVKRPGKAGKSKKPEAKRRRPKRKPPVPTQPSLFPELDQS